MTTLFGADQRWETSGCGESGFHSAGAVGRSLSECHIEQIMPGKASGALRLGWNHASVRFMWLWGTASGGLAKVSNPTMCRRGAMYILLGLASFKGGSLDSQRVEDQELSVGIRPGFGAVCGNVNNGGVEDGNRD